MADVLDRGSSIPVYQQLANWMEIQITTGKWPVDARLPGENNLSKTLGVSRGSLRKAISLLIAKNMLTQVHGKGTFVIAPRLDYTWVGRLAAVSEDLLLNGLSFTRHLLDQHIRPATAQEAQALALQPGGLILAIKRLWVVKNIPAFIHQALFDASRFGAIGEENLAQVTLAETLERRFGVRPKWASHAISVVRADPSLSDLLNLRYGEPVLFDEQIAYDEQDRHVALIQGWYRADRFSLNAIVCRPLDD
jgi:GntR family transcriptional regulator